MAPATASQGREAATLTPRAGQNAPSATAPLHHFNTRRNNHKLKRRSSGRDSVACHVIFTRLFCCVTRPFCSVTAVTTVSDRTRSSVTARLPCINHMTRVTTVLRRCYYGGTAVLRRCYSGVTAVLPRCYDDTSAM